jgi:DNA replication protein DnaC
VLALLAHQHIFQGHAMEWTTANRFQWAAQREFDQEEGADARRWLRKWKATPLLVFDDLGKQRWTDTVEAHFFDLIDTRLAHHRPIWWTGNTHPSNMVAARQLSKDRGAPVVSRLIEASTMIDLSDQQYFLFDQ